MRHGYLSIVGFVLKIATVVAAMLPPLLLEFPQELNEFTVFQMSFLVVKVALGITGTIMGLICIVPWLLKNREEKSCDKVRRWMLPTLIVWILTVILGAVAYLGDML